MKMPLPVAGPVLASLAATCLFAAAARAEVPTDPPTFTDPLDIDNPYHPFVNFRIRLYESQQGHADLTVIQADSEGGTLKVDQIRDSRKILILKPYMSKFRVAMFLRILKEGQPAVDDWRNVLSAGGTLTPVEFAKAAGVEGAVSFPARLLSRAVTV